MVVPTSKDIPGPVELFKHDEPAHFMGKGKTGQGPERIGRINNRTVKAEMAAEEKGNFLSALILPGRKLAGQAGRVILFAAWIKNDLETACRTLPQKLPGALAPDYLVRVPIGIPLLEDADIHLRITTQPGCIVVNALVQVGLPGFTKKEKNELQQIRFPSRSRRIRSRRQNSS